MIGKTKSLALPDQLPAILDMAPSETLKSWILRNADYYSIPRIEFYKAVLAHVSVPRDRPRTFTQLLYRDRSSCISTGYSLGMSSKVAHLFRLIPRQVQFHTTRAQHPKLLHPWLRTDFARERRCPVCSSEQRRRIGHDYETIAYRTELEPICPIHGIAYEDSFKSLQDKEIKNSLLKFQIFLREFFLNSNEAAPEELFRRRNLLADLLIFSWVITSSSFVLGNIAIFNLPRGAATALWNFRSCNEPLLAPRSILNLKNALACPNEDYIRLLKRVISIGGHGQWRQTLAYDPASSRRILYQRSNDWPTEWRDAAQEKGVFGGAANISIDARMHRNRSKILQALSGSQARNATRLTPRRRERDLYRLVKLAGGVSRHKIEYRVHIGTAQ